MVPAGESPLRRLMVPAGESPLRPLIVAAAFHAAVLRLLDLPLTLNKQIPQL
jgi:hypothetical protein